MTPKSLTRKSAWTRAPNGGGARRRGPGEIEAAALEVFAARGFAAAKLEDRPARAGLSKAVYSAHYIADKALRDPVARYLAQERPAVERDIAMLETEFSPFRRED